MFNGFSSAFASDYAGRAYLVGAVYITPMKAQEALFAGAQGVRHADGSLRIGGAVLIGLSGKPYRFVTEQTAATWCASAARVIEAERALVNRLTDEKREAWIERKNGKLEARADAILARAAKQTDQDKRAALIEEAAWCQVKWM